MTKDKFLNLIRSRPDREPYRRVATAYLTPEEIAREFGPPRSPPTARPPRPPLGITGTKLKEVLAEVELTDFKGCGCTSRVSAMNSLGVQWCKDNRAGIVDWLRKAANKAGWLKRGMAAAMLIRQPWFKVSDPYGSIVDESIRRSEDQP